MFKEAVILLSGVPEGRVFGFDLQMFAQVGIQLFNAGLLAAALSFILYKPVQQFLRNRLERIKTRVRQTESDMAQAGALKEEYEKNLAQIERERAAILEDARRLASEQCREALSDARREAGAIMERAAQDISIAQDQAKEAMRRQIIEVASAMANKLISSSIDKETQDRIYDETLSELEEAAWPS